MALQTTYAENMPIGSLGRRVNMEEWNTITRTLEGATPLLFGAPVQRGATAGDAHGCAIFTTGDFIGISEANVVLQHDVADRYEQYDSVAICESGVIWVNAGTGGATAGTPAYYIAASNTWTSTVGSNLAVPGAEFDSTAAAGGLVKLRVRRAVPAA